jgi:hypothetical protein
MKISLKFAFIYIYIYNRQNFSVRLFHPISLKRRAVENMVDTEGFDFG